MPKIHPKTQVERIASQFEGCRKNCNGYIARCPAHDDSNPSLSIRQGDKGGVVVYCHAGCQTPEILEAVGLQARDLMPDAKRIAATYDYRDENDELLYQSVRYEPKDFRQRRPSGEGRWEWSTRDVRRVLYRLPELLQADKKETVFIVEGEKDADRLAHLGLVATTNIGGAGKWRPEYCEPLRGHNVVILPDNDVAGWEHASSVAQQLYGVAASIKIVELNDLPVKGDVSDWLNDGGSKARLENWVRRTREYDPATQRAIGSKNTVGSDPTGDETEQNGRGKHVGKPVGLDPLGDVPMPGGSLGKVAVPPFPVEALPKLLRSFVQSVADALPCPVDFPAVMMLPVLGTFIGRKQSLEIKKGWQERPLLWTACVARSGDRKSPAFETVTQPLRRRQQILLAQYLKEKDEWDKQPADDRGPEPNLKQIHTTDTTIEALKVVSATNPNGIIYPADELSGWARSIGQYKGGHGDDKQIWLSIWSGIQIVVNRKSSPRPIIINEPFVAVTGGVQPDALPDLIDDSREDGFSARILFSYPDPIPSRDWSEEIVKQLPVFNSICEQLWETEPSAEPITFSAPAKARWVEWVNGHRRETPPDNLHPTWSKAEGHCARIALILFFARKLCNETGSDQLDDASIAGAIQIIEYFKGHAARVYSQLARTTGKDRAARAIRWIRKNGGTVTARLARMNGFTKTAEEAIQLFEDLKEYGHGTVIRGKQGNVTFQLHQDSSPRE